MNYLDGSKLTFGEIMTGKPKLRVGIVSSSVWLKTGFSTFMRVLLPYLYKTGKYELFHLSQGVGDCVEFQRYPWTTQPAIRNELIDHARFNNPNEEAYRRYISYGNASVEEFIIKNKLDCLIHCEDGWSSDIGAYLGAKWFPFFKDNFLQHTTVDSLPILPLYKEYGEKCKMWTWASFAERALKEEDQEKFKNVETVHGALDTSEYFPISKEEKTKLRKEFNIDLNSKIFIFLGRNQLRKLYSSALKSFSMFKKQNPADTSKLYFHCSWSEPGGWPMERLISDYKLKREDVLTTYFCQKCGKWEIKSFDGEGKDCRYCSEKGQQITAGVTSTITNKELSKIYGIADASLSIFTSGGFEYTNAQSLLCGLPLLCSDYSSGEDFINNDFVFRCDGSLAYEVQTGFEKFTPNLNTMVSFYKTICEMSEDSRLKIGKKGREWALSKFDIKVIGKKYEQWLDSRQPINWDYKYKEEAPKNPNAQIPQIPDNQEWVLRLYKDILNMDLTAEDSGVKFWLSELSAGRRNRNEIHQFFIMTANQENQKNQQNKPIEFSSLLENNSKKHFLLVCKESGGDILYASCILKSLRESYSEKEWNIYFACDQQFHDLLNGNPFIDKILPYLPFMESELQCTGQGMNKGIFDGYCFLTTDTQRHLSYLTNNKLSLFV